MSGYFNNVYPSNGNNRSYGDRSFDQQQHSASNQNHWRSQEGPNMRGEFGQFPVYPEGSWRQDPFSSNQRQDNSFNGQDWRGSYGQQNERFDAGDQNTQQRYNNQDRNIQQRYGERDRGDQQQQRYDDRDRNAQSQQRYDEKDRSSQRYDDRDRDWRSNEGSVGSRSSHYDDTDRDWRRNDYNEGRSRRDDRDRDYRDSPPSRRDDRDSWKRRGSRERSYRRSSPRRSRSPPRRDNRDTNATNKIMLTAVPEGFDRDEMNIIISQQGFSPIDVRIIHKNSGNGTRSFGFIEFETVDQAREYIKYNNGFLKFPNNFNCRLEYAREPQGGQVPETSRSAGSSAGGPADWNCSKCGINNFNRRENCFKCGINKRDSDELEAKGYSLVGSEPCDTLLVRELPTSANELSIIQAFGFYSTIPIQRVHVGSSKRYCLMQMRSIEEASYFLQAFNRVVPQINNCVVIVSYSRVSLNKVLMADSVEAIKSQTGVSTSQVQKDPTNSAAMLAYNAIQMSKMGRAPNPSDRQTISTPVGVFPIYPKPDSRVFQLEPTTGYFYEPNTGFYYDPKTDYYYDPVTCQWCFWTTEFSTFIPCNGDNMEARERLQQNEKTLKEKEAAVENPEAATVTTSEPDKKKKKKEKKPKEEEVVDANKPKTAKDIQREMNQWAKRQEKVKLSFNKDTDERQPVQSAKAWEAEDDEEDEQLEQIANSYSRNDQNPTQKFDINDFLDRSLIACLLCQRQFKSLDVLDKHCQKSDLHKTNVQNKMKEMGIKPAISASSTGFSIDVEAPSASSYRDRAKERRQLYGIDPGLDELVGQQSDVNIAEEAAQKAIRPLDHSNIGNKLLKNMGWQEGTGLGRQQQGIVNPIAAEQRVQGVGLGAAGSKIAGLTWKERVKQSTLARYQDIQNREQ